MFRHSQVSGERGQSDFLSHTYPRLLLISLSFCDFLFSLFISHSSFHRTLFLSPSLYSTIPLSHPTSRHSLAEACVTKKDAETNVLSQFMPFLLEKLLAVTNRYCAHHHSAVSVRMRVRVRVMTIAIAILFSIHQT